MGTPAPLGREDSRAPPIRFPRRRATDPWGTEPRHEEEEAPLRRLESSPWSWLGSFARRLEVAAMATAWMAMAVLAGEAYATSLDAERVVPGVRLGGEPIGGLDGPALSERIREIDQERMHRSLTLVAGHSAIETTPAQMGAIARHADAVRDALAVGRDGDVLENLRARLAAREGRTDLTPGYGFDQNKALQRLREWAPEVERPSLPTRFDLEARAVLPAERGTFLLPYDSLSSIAIGLATGAERIDLKTQSKAAVEDPLADLVDQLDVSVVLGSFETPYASTPDLADRKHNLEVGAAAIDATVIRPGAVFSFNEVVGDRSDQAGYRYAPGITAGEMIDVLGGGICQVSSTLYGAAFFAGLELVSARPHSRPSSYVDMGLDSTVVYPNIDLKLRNPFDFPVVLHMTVRQGQVRAEVLGPRRPYRVAFERDVMQAVPYDTIWRDDPRLRTGHQEVVQQGKRGFAIRVRRVLYEGTAVAHEESWDLQYPPTTEILRRGTHPEGRAAEPEPVVALRDPAARLRLVQ